MIFRGLVENQFELISKIINSFDENLNRTLECQRIAIVVLCLCVSNDIQFQYIPYISAFFNICIYVVHRNHNI